MTSIKVPNANQRIVNEINKDKNDIDLPYIENIDKVKNDLVEIIKENEDIHYKEKEQLGPDAGLLVSRIPVVTSEENELDRELSKVQYLKSHIDPQNLYFKGVDPLRYVPIFEQRHKERENVAFQKFLLNSIDPNDTYQISKIQELFPEVWDQRYKMMEKEAEKYRKLAELNLKGKAESAEDFIILYNIANGLIEYDPEVLRSVMGLNEMEQTVRVDSNRFRRGILNYTKYRKLVDPKVSQTLDISKPFDPTGNINFRRALDGNARAPQETPSALTNMTNVNRTIRGLYI